MPAYTVTSDDSLTISGRVFVDFADGDVTMIEYPNDLADSKTGKNGNGIISRNRQGDNATMVLRLLRGSSDDQFMQNLMAAALNNWTGQTLLTGEFVKQLGDGQGNVARDVISLQGGFFSKQVAAKENVEGQTDQGAAIYNLKFIVAARSIQ